MSKSSYYIYVLQFLCKFLNKTFRLIQWCLSLFHGLLLDLQTVPIAVGTGTPGWLIEWTIWKRFHPDYNQTPTLYVFIYSMNAYFLVENIIITAVNGSAMLCYLRYLQIRPFLRHSSDRRRHRRCWSTRPSAVTRWMRS